MRILKDSFRNVRYNDGIDVDNEADIVAEDVKVGKKANEVSYGRLDINFEDLAKGKKINRQHGKASREIEDIDIEEFLTDSLDIRDYSWYNEIELAPSERERIQSDALTWDAKHRNVLRSRTLSNNITYHYIIDNDGIVHVYGREVAKNIHTWEEDYVNSDTTQPNQITKEFGNRKGLDGSNRESLQNGRKSGNVDSNDYSSLRAKGRGDGGRDSKNASVPYGKTQARVRSPYLPLVKTFTDVSGMRKNVIKVNSEYMIEGNHRAKHSPSIQAAIDTENERVIKSKVRYLPTEKGRRVVKAPRPLFFASTAFVDTNGNLVKFSLMRK